MRERQESHQEQAPTSEMSRLWRRYRFPGEPVKEGTQAAERLANIAKQYVDTVLSERKDSDPIRRELHNKLAVMLVGETRSGMDDKRADDIADFAAELAYGEPMEGLFTMKHEHESEVSAH